MYSKRIIALGAAMAVASGALIGCGSDSSTGGDATPTASFVTPSAGSTVESSFTAQVSLADFAINGEKVGMAPMTGEGHLHFSLDDGKYDTPEFSGANGELAVKLGVAGKYSPSVAPSIMYKNIPAGPHTLKVFLANNDHSDTGKTAEVAFTVKATPTASVLSPKDGDTVDGTFTAKVDLSQFMINAENVGKAPVEGEGHLHFSLDEGKYDFPKYSGANGELAEKLGVAGKYSPSVTPSVTYKGIPAGEHTLTVFLANNDHSDTGASTTVNFTVK